MKLKQASQLQLFLANWQICMSWHFMFTFCDSDLANPWETSRQAWVVPSKVKVSPPGSQYPSIDSSLFIHFLVWSKSLVYQCPWSEYLVYQCPYLVPGPTPWCTSVPGPCPSRAYQWLVSPPDTKASAAVVVSRQASQGTQSNAATRDKTKSWKEQEKELFNIIPCSDPSG